MKPLLRRLIRDDGQQAVPLSLAGVVIVVFVMNADLIANGLDLLAEWFGNVAALLSIWW